jgi:malate permease and related proteins
MEILALLILCFLLGIVLRMSGHLPENAPAALNGFIIHISLPALILAHVHRLPVDATMLYAVAAPWILFCLSLATFLAITRLMRLSRATTGGLILTGGLANTSFVGLPMIETFYGAGFLGIGILIDTLGTYLVLSTLGIFVAILFSPEAGRQLSAAEVSKKILLFPPFQALVLAIALRPLELPAGFELALERLGATLAPLALISVGYQLRLGALQGRISPLALGLAFKLVLGPIIVALVLVKMLGASGPITQVTIFEVAMAPQIGGAIVAIQHKLDPELVTLMVGIGIPLSFVTLPLWWHVLQGV